MKTITESLQRSGKRRDDKRDVEGGEQRGIRGYLT